MSGNEVNGLTHNLLKENYAWVDERLREKYYGYALTSDNVDEFESAGLLQEHYSWVDLKLAELCYPHDDDIVPLCPTPFTWYNYKTDVQLECIEESDNNMSTVSQKRNRSESDISDYINEVSRVLSRLSFQSPIPTCKYIIIPNSVYDEEYKVESTTTSTVVDEDIQYVTDISSISSQGSY